MNTKRFDVEYEAAAMYGSQVELSARVTTDGANHRVRQRYSDKGVGLALWPESGRVYTPDQIEHVRGLFAHHYPDAKKKIEDWLAAHSFDLLDEKVEDVALNMQPDGKVTRFSFHQRWS